MQSISLNQDLQMLRKTFLMHQTVRQAITFGRLKIRVNTQTVNLVGEAPWLVSHVGMHSSYLAH